MNKTIFCICILIFSLCSCSQLTNEVETQKSAEIGNKESNSSYDFDKMIIIEIKSDRNVYLNNESIGTIQNLEKLDSALKQKFSDRKEKLNLEKEDFSVILIAPKGLKKDDIATVVEAAKKAGAKPIGLEIQE